MKNLFRDHRELVVLVIHTAIIVDIIASIYFQYDSRSAALLLQ